MATTVTRQDSKFFTHALPNGLQLLGQEIPGVESVAAVFYVNTGTRDEVKSEMGVSHFLEHMAFKRTARMTGNEIDLAFEQLGADHNAGTWKEMTFYWARVLNENVEPVVDILSQLTHPVLEKADFDLERGVILEEIARYEDMPSHVLLDQFMRDFFRQHPLAWETLGTSETIKALTVEEMRAYWQRHYGAGNQLFAIAGKFDWETVKRQIEELTAGWETGEPTVRNDPAVFQPGFAVYRREYAQEQIAIGVPSVSNRDPRYYSAAVAATILGDDTGSRLFWSLYQEGLAETATAQVFDFDDNGLLWVHISTEPDKAQLALDAAEAELRRFQAFDVSQAELDRAKAKLNSSVIIGGESTNERVMALINSWLTHGRLETLEDARQKIEDVTLDGIRAYLREFPLWPRQVVTAVGPLESGDLSNPMG